MLYVLDLAGTIVFAISGALMAIARQQNPLWVLVSALLTAVGGGTIRDLLLHRPVFWTVDPNYLALALIVGLFTVAFVQRFPLKQQQLFVFDKVSMATFTVVGTHVALQHFSPFSSSHLGLLCVPLMAWLTAFGGGTVRDLLSAQIPQVLNDGHDIFTSIFGSVLYGVFFFANSHDGMVGPVAIALLVALRLSLEPHRQQLTPMKYHSDLL